MNGLRTQMKKSDVTKISNLMNSLSDMLEGKEVDTVIPALTLLLANAGVMSGTEPSNLLAYIAITVTNTYSENSSTDEIVH
jgi:hypothetical protein